MIRSKILIPAVALMAGLFVMEDSAKAQVSIGVRFGQPNFRPAPPIYRPVPLPPPVYVPYPVYRPAPPEIVVPQQCFRVVYRECDHDQWQVFRDFRNHERAHETVAMLRQRGFQAYVDHD